MIKVAHIYPESKLEMQDTWSIQLEMQTAAMK